MLYLFLTLISLSAEAREGFFTKDQIQTNFNVSVLEGASLLVEEIAGPGSWKQVGNAFFITDSGYILTNYHVANTCVRANKDYFKEKYGAIVNLSRQGYYSEFPEGLPCKILRGAVHPKTNERLRLSLVSLPPVPERAPADTAQGAEGPFFDFAILKVSAEEHVPTAFHKLDHGNSDAVQDLDFVYLMGFPAATARAEDSELIQNGAYQEVVTGDFRVSEGQVLPLRPEYYYQPKASAYFYTDTDGGAGSSGSGLVNSQGKMIGLILGSGDDKNTASASGCIMKYEYCGGVSLYLRSQVVVDTISRSFPELGLILF